MPLGPSFRAWKDLYEEQQQILEAQTTGTDRLAEIREEMRQHLDAIAEELGPQAIGRRRVFKRQNQYYIVSVFEGRGGSRAAIEPIEPEDV